MTCKIDHTDTGAIPRCLCRACTPMGANAPIVLKSAPAASAEPWPFAVRRDNCTPADIAVMHQLASGRAADDKVKTDNRIGKMLSKKANKPPEGARWDPRTNAWIVA